MQLIKEDRELIMIDENIQSGKCFFKQQGWSYWVSVMIIRDCSGDLIITGSIRPTLVKRLGPLAMITSVKEDDNWRLPDMPGGYIRQRYDMFNGDIDD